MSTLLPLMPPGTTYADAEAILSAVPGVDPADLVGVAELAEELGVSRQSVCNWAAGRARTGMPSPVIRLRATPVWSRTAVRAWFDNGRPR